MPAIAPLCPNPDCSFQATLIPGAADPAACPRCGTAFAGAETIAHVPAWAMAAEAAGGTGVMTPDHIESARRRSDSTVHTPSAPVLPNLPGYEIERVIGRGGMGVVYQARHVALNRPVALKMILGGQYTDDVAQIRFLIEAEVLAALHHQNIVPVYDFGRHDGQPYFALEFVAGGTLADRVKRDGKLAPTAAATLVAKLADAMAEAHSKGVVHRDLKPANVLLTEAGEPKVTDFGLAKVGQSEVTLSGSVMGTPSYMAPEQAAGKTREIGTACDIYALGAILYDLLAGRPPFQAESGMGTIQQVLTREPTKPRDLDRAIPRDLETICLKCLEKDPRRRYAAATDLGDDLRPYLDGRPIAARPVGTVERVWKWVKRHPTRAAGVVAAGLLAVGVSIGLGEVRRQREADRIDAERRLADERVAAEKKRTDDLIAADELAKEKQRQTRADALAQALASADTPGLPRLVEDLAEVRDLARPKLAELAAKPVSEKAGLHARLALLADEPTRVAGVAAYLPDCRADELLTIRLFLKPHAAAVAPDLWKIATDDAAEAGRRVRAACALAELTPDDPRWAFVAPAVVERTVRENPLQAVVWAAALEPVRSRLLPTLLKRYPEARTKIKSGTLDESELVAEASAFDLTADLLARYATDRPAELAELAMTVDARHHKLFEPAFLANRAKLVPVLKAELTKTVTPDWGDAVVDGKWTAVADATRQRVEAAGGLIAERFAYVEAVPLADFAPLANTLTPSGYRPLRVRPYATGKALLAAAVWTRDGVAWQYVGDATKERCRPRTRNIKRPASSRRTWPGGWIGRCRSRASGRCSAGRRRGRRTASRPTCASPCCGRRLRARSPRRGCTWACRRHRTRPKWTCW